MIARAMNRPIRFCRRGFSLVEVLLAIFILGIGIISITALFPAGIAQQRLSNDDVLGPIVANNAISIIRSKVRQEDFGSFEEFQQYFFGDYNDDLVPQAYFSRTIPGDWGWMRPGFLLQDDISTGRYDERGAIDIFSYRYSWQEGWSNWGGPQDIACATDLPDGWPEMTQWGAMGGNANNQLLFGIPYNTATYGNQPPNFIINQRERYYPMQTASSADEDATPQYVWDCMFRRYQGRVYVAIFVYRVSSNNTAVPYVVPDNGDQLSPMPFHLDLVNWGAPYPGGARNVIYDDPGDPNSRPIPYVLGSENVAGLGDIDTELPEESWQRTRQWLLDQNNNVHRVVNVQYDGSDPDFPNEIRVELTRPLAPVRLGWHFNATNGTIGGGWWDAIFNNVEIPSDSEQYYYADAFSGSSIHPNLSSYHFDVGVLTDLWYIPRRVDVNYPQFGTVEFTLTPVYVTVKEL